MGNDGAFLQDEGIKGGRLVSDSHPVTFRTTKFLMPQDRYSCTGYTMVFSFKNAPEPSTSTMLITAKGKGTYMIASAL